LATSALAAPSLLEGVGEHHPGSHHQESAHHELPHHESNHHNNPHHEVAFETSASELDEVRHVIGLIKDDRQVPDEFGHYNFEIESEDGIIRSESGSVGSSGAIVQTGSYS